MSNSLADLIANALVDAKVSLCSHVPGFGGTESFRAYQRVSGSKAPAFFHEEVAYAASHAIGLLGQRSACLIKTHGFAKATNAVLSSLSTGTLGGVVVIAFDDRDGSHSDNVIDAEAFIRGSSIPYERLSFKDAYSQIQSLFEKSEKLGLPCLLIVDAADIHREATFEKRPVEWKPLKFVSKPHLNVACPPMASFQKKVFDQKIEGEQSWREARPAQELRVTDLLTDDGKKELQDYFRVFEAFRSVVRKSPTPVAGDAGTSGLFAFAPYHCIDFVSYMGGSTALALGMHLAGQRAWAVTGDFSFIAAGVLGLLEASFREVPLKLLILDNGQASATGGQPVNPRALETALGAYSKRVTRVVVNEVSAEELEKLFARAHQSDQMEIVVAQVR